MKESRRIIIGDPDVSRISFRQSDDSRGRRSTLRLSLVSLQFDLVSDMLPRVVQQQRSSVLSDRKGGTGHLMLCQPPGISAIVGSRKLLCDDTCDTAHYRSYYDIGSKNTSTEIIQKIRQQS